MITEGSGLFLDYASERILSSNAISQSVEAVELSSGRTRFLKREVIAGEFPREFVRRTLMQAFDSQRHLSGLIVNKARTIANDRERLTISYPYLDPSSWRPLSAQDFADDPRVCLTKICFALDYLHLMGFVHLDLKDSNILVNRSRGVMRLRIVDLEFLRPAGTPCDGKILGTITHIAPEILRNEQVYPETDNYSFGVLLAGIMSEIRADRVYSADNQLLEKLELLARVLQHEDRLSRPRFLLETMRSTGILGTDEHEKIARRLLCQLFISKFKSAGRSSADADAFMLFLHQNVKILGLHPELVSLSVERVANGQHDVFAVFKRLLKESPFLSAGEYWILNPSDSLLQWAYKRLDSKHQSLSNAWTAAANLTDDNLAIATGYMHKLKDAGQLEQSFLLGAEIYERLQHSTAGVAEKSRLAIARDLGQLSYRLNRLEQAHEYFEVAITGGNDNKQDRADTFRKWAVVSISLGKTDCTLETMQQGMELAHSSGDNYLRLHLQRLSAWQSISVNDFDVAERELRVVHNEALNFGYLDVAALATYSLGVICWKLGQYSDAKRELLSAVTICEKGDNQEVLIPILAMKALVENEMGEFDSAIEDAKRAAGLCDTLKSMGQLPSISLAAVFACIRLTRFRESERWLQRYLTGGLHRTTPRYLLAYYQAAAFSYLHQGRIAEAIDVCTNAVKLSTDAADAKLLGKVYYILSESSLLSGDAVGCTRYCDSARQLFTQCNDVTSEQEASLIAALSPILSEELSDLSPVLDLVRQLNDRGSRFCAMSGAYAIFLKDSEQTTNVRALLAEISENVGVSEVPLFSILRQLIELPNWPQCDSLALLSALKKGYSKLLDSGQLFHAMLTALRVAEIYGELGHRKHQIKFLEQAELAASRLANNVEAERIKKLITELRQNGLEPKRETETLVAISAVLSKERDFQKAAGQLLRFATEETGAERGVLLLRRAGDTRLTVVASINCDDESVHDVIDFSLTVPHSALSKPEPTIVEDAISDIRTHSMKSIVLHNVRSIIATPMYYDGELLGVLYLDHHSIPALFSQNDVEYVSAIANFVAVSLVNARDYRDVMLVRDELAESLTRTGVGGAFITKDPIMRDLLEMIPTIGRSDAPVLLIGESGTGKEILCQMIHEHSRRKSRPLIKMNCAAIADSMVESELFGVARGAATGVVPREGKFAAADGSTLYMDEIGDMPLDLQAKVLRVVEYQEFEKVGSVRSERVDVRYIYGTNKDLTAAVKEGKFRNDLLFRINTFTIMIPPLRERAGDIPLLAEHFIKVFSIGKKTIKFTPEAMATLTVYSWPGNVRELRNLVERYCVLYAGKEISVKMLPDDIVAKLESSPSDVEIKGKEGDIIRLALIKSGWNRSKAAAELGLPLTTLRRKITLFGIRQKF
jgi:Nif-specific regulatory protein